MKKFEIRLQWKNGKEVFGAQNARKTPARTIRNVNIIHKHKDTHTNLQKVSIYLLVSHKIPTR